MAYLTLIAVFMSFFIFRGSSQYCSQITSCPSGLTCCYSAFKCYNTNNEICCGSLTCESGSKCDTSGGSYSSCTSTTNLSDGAIAGIIIALIFVCCCIPIGVFLCFFGGLAMLQGRNNQPPPSQQPVYVVNNPPPGQPVYNSNLPPGYVQGQVAPPIYANDKMDHVGVAASPNM